MLPATPTMHFALCLALGLLAVAPTGQAHEAATKEERPLIIQSLIAAPRTIGAFRLKETTYRPEQKAAGAMFRYAAVPEPDLTVDVFVYPAGREQQAEAIKRGMVDFHDSLQAAQQAGYFRNLEILDEAAFPLSTSTPGPPKDRLAALITASEPIGRRIDMTMEAGESNAPLRSRGYLFYKHLYFYKVRVSVPAAAMAVEEFGEFTDHAARILVGNIDTLNIGGCADDPVYVDEKADADIAVQALITQVAQRNQENCLSSIDEARLAKHSKGAETVTIDYAPGDWGGR